MPITTVAVTCTAARPDGSLIAGGKFRFLLSNTDTENGLVVPREILATANAQGVAVANLWPNSLGALGTQYRVLLSDPLGSTIDLGSCTVPTSACNLHAILGLGTAPTLDQATVAKLAAQTAAAASSTSATQSASSATQAATSATAAAVSATGAANSATSAAGSVTSAANSATAAGNSATSAASSNTAAGASATSAASSAADALSSKNAAATSATNAASSVTNAAASVTAAQTSATNAATSATTATTKASEAATSATNAATSATAAATSETNAQGLATTAATQASNAATSATNAASSASSAASSAAAVAAVTTGNMSSQNANSVAITGGSVSDTSITVKDNVFTLQDNLDPTKQAQFQLSGIGTGVTATYTMPAVTGTIAALNATQTFTAVNTFTASFNTFGASTITGTQAFGSGATASGNTKTVNIGTGGLSGSTTAITVGSANGSTTTMLGSTVIGGVAGNQSLQVNNVASAVNYLQILGATTGGGAVISSQGTDTNIQIDYRVKGGGYHAFTTDSGNLGQFLVTHTASAVNQAKVTGSPTGSAVTMSTQGSDTNVGFAIATKNAGGIQFRSGNGLQAFVSDTASAVNYLQLTGAATGAAPELSAQGSDTNISLLLRSKGTGVVALGGSTVANSGVQVTTTASSVNYMQLGGGATGFAPYLFAGGTDTNIGLNFTSKGVSRISFQGSSFGQTVFDAQPVASAVNFMRMTGAVTTGAPELSAQGSDTNINLKLTPKGTGVLQFGTHTATVLTPTGFITITDAGGTSRRLLVG